ncbi:MAG: hypothetical protein ACXWAX_10630, partial [Chthoniobacterales bacterium]
MSSQLPPAPMITIPIRAGQTRYDALVGRGILSSIGEHVARLFRGQRCAIISDTNTAGLFAEKIIEQLRAVGFESTLITFPAGENSKSL